MGAVEVHFDMPDSEYFARDALSASGMKSLLASPADFWNDFINPSVEDTGDSYAQQIGKAFHKRLLEGEDAFEEKYSIMPERGNYLSTIDEMQEFLKDRDIDFKKASKRDYFVELCREAGADIWDDVLKDALESGKELIKQDIWDSVQNSAAMLQRLPSCVRLFKDGRPEVSIFWTCERTGIKKKARIDYLKTTGTIVDLKTFSNPHKRPVTDAAIQSIVNFKYHIQAVHYTDAVKAAIQAGHEHFEKDAKPKFLFAFRQVDGAPNVRIINFAKFENFNGMGGSVNAHYRAGEDIVHRMSEVYKYWKSKNYAPEIPWIEDTGVHVATETDFPIYFLDGRS